MKAPLSWLKDFVDINVDVATLCSKLVTVGFEVEAVDFLGENIKNVFVGKILNIEKHPNADKLSICSVDIGTKKLQIVTGAKNISVGDKVPVAVDGAMLPNGKTIKSGELRGITSEGMLCSGEELSINESVYSNASVDGILILDECENIGENIIKTLGLDDYVLDISITANRPDCNSIVGIAREVASALKVKFIEPKTNFSAAQNLKIKDYVKADVIDKDLCPSYLLAAILDVKVEKSPIWLSRRLNAVGLRGINNIVDITNYVLIEIGQPMHSFDYREINDKTIIVRRAANNEKATLLNDIEYTLDNNALVIADKTNAVGLAGIMGGKNSGIKTNTTAVVFESATFIKECIRKTSKKLALRSDSSARFEKGLDTYTNYLGLKRALHLIEKLKCGKIASDTIEIVAQPVRTHTLEFRYERIKRLLGIEIPKTAILDILNALNIKTTIKNDIISCDVPPYRGDITRDCDIIEELIRVYGYEHITPTLLSNSAVTMGGKTQKTKNLDTVKELLRGFGYNEIVTYPFGGMSTHRKLNLAAGNALNNHIKIANPLGEELNLMRTTLAGNMLNTIKLNLSRKNTNLMLFECGKTYIAKELPLTDLPTENNVLCIGVCSQNADFYTIKDTISNIASEFNLNCNMRVAETDYLHPNISAEITIDGVNIGCIGKVHPVVCENFELPTDVYLAEINLDELFSAVEGKAVSYSQISKYPSIKRDLSLVVNDRTPVGGIISALKSACDLCCEISLFDVYSGEQVDAGKKSISLTLVFRADRTLRDEEVDKQIDIALKLTKERFGAILRQ